MTSGIILLSFGKPIYGYMAYHLAMSIKHHSPGVQICLVHDEESLRGLGYEHKQFFDTFLRLNTDDKYDKATTNGNTYMTVNPGRAKLRICNYLPYDHNIVLDVDSLLLKPIEPLFEHLQALPGYYYSQVIDTYTITAEREMPNMLWAYRDDVWSYYNLPDDARLPCINSSFAYIRRGEEAKALFARAEHNLYNGVPIGRLRYQWGGSYPDELAMNAACAQLGVNPDPGITPVLMSRVRVDNFTAATDNHYLLGIYGAVNFTHRSLVEYYDRLVHNLSRQYLKRNQEFKSHMLMKDKWANGKKKRS